MNNTQSLLTNKARKTLQASDRIVFTMTSGVPRWFGAIFLLAGLITIGAGIGSTLGVIKAEGNFWVAYLFGGVFALAGYCMMFYVSQIDFDLSRRSWQRQSGVLPFAKRAQGHFDDWSHVQFERVQRTSSNKNGTTYYKVWAVTLCARDSRVAPMTVSDLEFPSQIVERAEAVSLAKELAQRLHLPLREEDTYEIVPLPDESALPLASPVSGPLTPPPGKRLVFNRMSDGSASILVPGNPAQALPGLIPVIFVCIFLFFFFFLLEFGSLMLLFFSPPLLLSILAFLAVLAFSLVQQTIRVSAESVTVFSSLAGREFGRRTVPRRSIRGIEFQQSSGGGASVQAGGTHTSSGRNMVIVSDQTDLRIGGNLSQQELTWLQNTLLTLLSPSTRNPS